MLGGKQGLLYVLALSISSWRNRGLTERVERAVAPGITCSVDTRT